MEQDLVISYAERDLEVARAAENSLEYAEIHLEYLVKEEELSIRVLSDEIKLMRTRSQATKHQIASLQETLQAAGITPKPPLSPEMSSMTDRPSDADGSNLEFQPTPPAQLEQDAFIDHAERALEVARAHESSLEAAEHHLKGLVSGAESNIQALRGEIEAVRIRREEAGHRVASLQEKIKSENTTPHNDFERDEFILRTERALEVARTAEDTLKATEHHRECLVREEELSIKVLGDEINLVRTRSQAAGYQVASLLATLQAADITPNPPRSPEMSPNPNSPSYTASSIQSERGVSIDDAEKALEAARAAEFSFKAEEVHLEGLVSEAELRIQELRDEIENVRSRSQEAKHRISSLLADLQSEGITPKTLPSHDRSSIHYDPSDADHSESGSDFEEEHSEFEEEDDIYVGGNF